MLATVNGLHIGYDSYGEGRRALVLLHAFPLNRQQWAPQAEALAQRTGLRVLAPDLRGFGESALEIGPTTVEQMAEDVQGLLRELEIERFSVAGLSMGGYVAFQLFQREQRRIEGLILADTRATADSAEARAGREETALFVEQHGVPALLDRDAAKYFSPQTRERRQPVVDEARRIAGLNSDIGVAAASRGLGLRPDVTGMLLSIDCPTLVLVGDEDAITPPTDAQTLADTIPGARLEPAPELVGAPSLVALPEAGHLANLEQPELFLDALVQFVQRRLPKA